MALQGANAEPNSQTIALLLAYQRVCFVLGAAFCGFFALAGAWLNLLGPAGFMVLVVASFVSLRAGRVVFAATLLCVAMWAAPTWCSVVSGGLHSPLVIWSTPPVFMAAALLGWRASTYVATGSILAILVMALFGDPLAGINEFPAGPWLDALTAMSASSAVMVIAFYGFMFTTQAEATETRMKAARDALQDLKAAFDTHAIVATTDLQGRIVDVNDLMCRVSQYSRDELVGSDYRILCSGYHNRAFWAKAWDTISEGGIWRDQIRNRAKNGSFYWVDASIIPVLDGKGQPKQYITVRTDISERIWNEEAAWRAQDAAEQAAKIKADFLATMSHEIRTPMNGVSGMASLLADTELTTEQRQYLGALTTSSTALLVLIDDILDYSKMEAGKFELDPMPFSLREMALGVDELLSIKAEQKAISFAAIVDRSVPDMMIGDTGRLRQILVNLANNAVKFTSSGSVIVRLSLIEGAPEGQCDVLVSVTDTGIGMAQATADRMFVPFSQADASTVRKFGGTGLGLSIAQKLAGLMRSKITVTSAESQGSCFSFPLRLKLAESSRSMRVARGVVVLLISEEGCRQEALVETLFSMGADVRLVSDVQGAAVMDTSDVAVIIYRPAVVAKAEIGVAAIVSASETTEHRVIVMLPIQQLHGAASLCDAGARTVLSEPFSLSELRQALVPVQENQQALKDTHALFSGSVLVVDDNRINRMLAEAMLKKLGVDVALSSDGEAAIEAVRAGCFDMVFMDCQMPGMDGYEATRTLRAMGYSDLPIIALTAGAMKSDRDACFRAGMDAYLTKPISADRLERALRQYLTGECAVDEQELVGR